MLYSNTTGFNNAANGYSALFNNTTGNSNTANGYFALQNNTSGNYRTGIGSSANSTGAAYDNSTGLGYDADFTASNQVVIGNASVTEIGGAVNWSIISDGQFKKNVREDVKGLAFLQDLRPVTNSVDLHAIDDFFYEHYGEWDESEYDGKYDKEQIRYPIFIAQEVEAAAQNLGYDFSGVDAPKNEDDFYGLRYAEFVVQLVKAVLELNIRNEDLDNRIDAQQNVIEKQQVFIEELQSAISAQQKQINLFLSSLNSQKQ